jgi:hypothetical protein
MSTTEIRPFRWNVAKREQLGRLLDGPQTETYPDFETDLRAVSARWASKDAKLPAREDAHLRGLRLAARLFDHGCDRDERKRFVAEVAAQPEMSEAWLRAQVLRLRAIK